MAQLYGTTSIKELFEQHVKAFNVDMHASCVWIKDEFIPDLRTKADVMSSLLTTASVQERVRTSFSFFEDARIICLTLCIIKDAALKSTDAALKALEKNAFKAVLNWMIAVDNTVCVAESAWKQLTQKLDELNKADDSDDIVEVFKYFFTFSK